MLFDSRVTCLQLCAAMVAEQCVCIHICMADGALFGLTARAVSRIGQSLLLLGGQAGGVIVVGGGIVGVLSLLLSLGSFSGSGLIGGSCGP